MLDARKQLETVIADQMRNNNIREAFPPCLENLTESDFTDRTASDRQDFRSLRVFTIDGQGCQDHDDAISVTCTEDGTIIGVHIADVSCFVEQGTALDQEALDRGSSIYFPDRTIPMLPKILTDDLCSLVAGKDRKTLSILIRVDMDCNVIDYSITKGLIRSRVKGVYSEVNHRILSGKADRATREKYDCVLEDIRLLEHISDVLLQRRIAAGAVIQGNSEPDILIREDEICLVPQRRGKAERMIEELMILANRLVVEFMIRNRLPCLYRIQSQGERMAEYRAVVNRHYSLALDAYCHATSPIRRYSDIVVHRIISAFLAQDDALVQRTAAWLEKNDQEICVWITRRSRRAKNVMHGVITGSDVI